MLLQLLTSFNLRCGSFSLTLLAKLPSQRRRRDGDGAPASPLISLWIFFSECRYSSPFRISRRIVAIWVSSRAPGSNWRRRRNQQLFWACRANICHTVYLMQSNATGAGRFSRFGHTYQVKCWSSPQIFHNNPQFCTLETEIQTSYYNKTQCFWSFQVVNHHKINDHACLNIIIILLFLHYWI